MSETIQVCEIDRGHPDYQQERLLRNDVLLIPHGIPAFGWEQFDEICHHIIARVGGRVAGCVLLKPHEDADGQNVGQLMQMAVAGELQKQGIGHLLVEKVMERAASLKLKLVHCHARIDAVPFYEKNGFAVYGEAFWEVGIEHRHMQREVVHGTR